MYQSLLKDEKILAFLFRCDQELAEELRPNGCVCCGGRLHRADYPRKPRGLPFEVDPELTIRLSFCCGAEGCRKRVTPPSLRFFGRKVYWGLTVVVAAVSGRGRSEEARSVRRLIGASRRTLLRWRRWWRRSFPESRFWKESRGRFDRPLADADLPGNLLDRFSGGPGDQIAAMLRFLSPITMSPFSGSAF